MAEVLIAGCGYVGSALAMRLLESGDRVYGLRRGVSHLPAGVDPIQADLTALDSIPKLPSGITHVVYCAAAKSHDESSYRAIYLSGLLNLMRVLRESECAIERFLFVSSTGVYGQNDGEVVDERSETAPMTFSGRILLEAEEQILESKLPATVVRFSGIYGPGRDSLLRQVAQQTASYYLGLPHFSNRIHRYDCAASLQFLLQYPEELEAIYLASDEAPTDRADILRFIAGCLDVQAPKMLSANDAPPRLRSKNKRCSSSLLRSLGFSFRYPSFREGFAELCAEYTSGH